MKPRSSEPRFPRLQRPTFITDDHDSRLTSAAAAHERLQGILVVSILDTRCQKLGRTRERLQGVVAQHILDTPC